MNCKNCIHEEEDLRKCYSPELDGIVGSMVCRNKEWKPDVEFKVGDKAIWSGKTNDYVQHSAESCEVTIINKNRSTLYEYHPHNPYGYKYQINYAKNLTDGDIWVSEDQLTILPCSDGKPKSAHKAGEVFNDDWEYAGELRLPKFGEHYISLGEEVKAICKVEKYIDLCEILRPRKDKWTRQVGDSRVRAYQLESGLPFCKGIVIKLNNGVCFAIYYLSASQNEEVYTFIEGASYKCQSIPIMPYSESKGNFECPK